MPRSSFADIDVSSLSSPQEQRDLFVHLARVAESSERYDDMAKIMKRLVISTSSRGQDLTVEERNLLSVAYKNIVGSRRHSWRAMSEPDDSRNSAFDPLFEKFKARVAKEIEDICSDLIDILERNVLANASRNNTQPSARVFYIKMLGDYCRYRAESADASKNFDQKAAEHYAAAYELSHSCLPPTDPIRLGLALNYSVCFYEILKQPLRARDLAQEAFDLAISTLDQVQVESDYKDSTLIMQLLRDNLTLWAADAGEDEDQELEVVDDTWRENNAL